MAKSKSGGTRSYIRGRVGADVYSIGRDAKGKKQQVVRSLAESVANPQTLAQMRGRMIMSTIMQAMTALKPIVDHSFDNVVGRQPNLSEFISRNYSLVKADVAAHPASGNAFGLNQYQEKGAKRGAYVISDGKATIPSALVLTKATGVIAITIPADNITIGGLKSALNLGVEEYFTIVGIDALGNAEYERFRVNPELADSVAVSSSNINDVFAVEGNVEASLSIASNVISVTLSAVAGCCAVIMTKKTNDGFIHSKAVLGAGTGMDWTANVALPTYPIGAQNFLNGGDIFGSIETAGGEDVPEGGGGSGDAVNAPEITGEDNFATQSEVSITAESGASIYYTTDGSLPTTVSTVYSAPFNIGQTTTIKAIAVKNGVSSEVATKTLTKMSF